MKMLTNRQTEVLNFLKKYRRENSYPPTIREISTFFNISVKGAYDHIKALEKKGFIACRNKSSRAIEILGEDHADDTVTIPILGHVAAGIPLFAEENHDGDLTFPAEMVPKGPLFALHVEGESMIGAGILDGDTAVFKQQPIAENGEIVVAMVEEAVTLKRFFKEKNRIRLQSENPAFPPIYTQEARILGKLVNIIRRYV